MLLKIANELEVPVGDVVCIINLDRKEDKINMEFISENDDIVNLCGNESRSLVIVSSEDKNIIYISPYSVSAICKSVYRSF